MLLKKPWTACCINGQMFMAGFMKMNMSYPDRYIRFLIGISFLLNIIILQTEAIAIVILLTLGFSSIYTSLAGYCIVYDIFLVKIRRNSL